MTPKHSCTAVVPICVCMCVWLINYHYWSINYNKCITLMRISIMKTIHKTESMKTGILYKQKTWHFTEERNTDFSTQESTKNQLSNTYNLKLWDPLGGETFQAVLRSVGSEAILSPTELGVQCLVPMVWERAGPPACVQRSLLALLKDQKHYQRLNKFGGRRVEWLGEGRKWLHASQVP